MEQECDFEEILCDENKLANKPNFGGQMNDSNFNILNP